MMGCATLDEEGELDIPAAALQKSKVSDVMIASCPYGGADLTISALSLDNSRQTTRFSIDFTVSALEIINPQDIFSITATLELSRPGANSTPGNTFDFRPILRSWVHYSSDSSEKKVQSARIDGNKVTIRPEGKPALSFANCKISNLAWLKSLK